MKKQGRPRIATDQFAVWKPPKGWVRVVAWVSGEERKALKQIALDADTSVANLIRTFATGLANKAIRIEDLVSSFRPGAIVMEKIPTIFDRDEQFGVTDHMRAGCEWVFSGEGTATEKLDGMNIRLTVRGGVIVRVEKRRNPSKLQKAQGVKDGWYVDANEFGPDDKWIFEAARNTDVGNWPDGEHSCEAIGPNIQGNPLELSRNVCVPFNLSVPIYTELPRTYIELRKRLETLESRYSPGRLAEGIVFHHPDGRRAKIKRKDFRNSA